MMLLKIFYKEVYKRDTKLEYTSKNSIFET